MNNIAKPISELDIEQAEKDIQRHRERREHFAMERDSSRRRRKALSKELKKAIAEAGAEIEDRHNDLLAKPAEIIRRHIAPVFKNEAN